MVHAPTLWLCDCGEPFAPRRYHHSRPLGWQYVADGMNENAMGADNDAVAFIEMQIPNRDAPYRDAVLYIATRRATSLQTPPRTPTIRGTGIDTPPHRRRGPA